MWDHVWHIPGKIGRRPYERNLASRWARTSSEGPPRSEKGLGTKDAKQRGHISGPMSPDSGDKQACTGGLEYPLPQPPL